MHKTSHIHAARVRRHQRVRARVHGTPDRPRLSVRRSLRYLHVQLIDDTAGRTLVAVTDAGSKKFTGTKTQRAEQLGQALAAAAQAKKITRVVFDRGGSKYHGRIKAVAEAARQAGLTF